MCDYDMAVVGMGYVGLPLAREAVAGGLQVVGYDIDVDLITRLRTGVSHIDDVTNQSLDEMLNVGFELSSDPCALGRARTICVCVPTPLSTDGGPDLSAVTAASRDIADNMSPGTLVIFESTTYPGSTEEDAKPILEKNGLQAGVDFSLAFSPERVDPGNPLFGIKNTPKVVGGLTAACRTRAQAHYEQFIEVVVPAKGLREAEMAKLLENTYRHVNIALVNEMAKFSHELGIDIWDVIKCAATKPFGFQPFYPGPGVGGHCIPIDPNYLSYKVQSELGYRFRFVELAQEVNNGMPAYVVDRCAEMLNEQRTAVNGSTILLLGVTYKPNIADQRESPALPIARELLRRKACVMYHDPYVDEWVVGDHHLTSAQDLDLALRSADLAVLLQAHDDYDSEALGYACRLLLDTRGKTTGQGNVLL